jgi:ribosome-binding protein aMBF1 (putative translation factor)
MKEYSIFKKESLKDPAVKAAYNALETEYQIAAMIIEKRIQEGLTQSELAKKAGTKQSAISRLESGDSNPSISFLSKIAKALDLRLVISMTK